MNGSLRRRSKDSWQLTIDLGRDPNGKRDRRFVSVKGTKREADAKLRELLSAYDKGIPLTKQRPTVTNWMARWLKEYVEQNCRQLTKERYERAIKRHILPEIGHIQLTKLTPHHIKSLESSLSANGMSPAGVDLIHSIVSGSLKYALQMEILWRNPAQSVTTPKASKDEVSPPDISGVKKILDIADTERDPLFSCLHLIAYTGLRRGEALALRWQDINIDTGAISVARSLSRSVEQGLIFQPPKTSSGRRVIDVDERTVQVLRAHQGEQLLLKTSLGDGYHDEDLVFPSPLGGPLNPMALTRCYKKYAKRLGFTKARIHDLRHFHASVMLQSGQTLLLVGKRLGHASIATTGDIYGHLLPGWQKEAADAFAKAMEHG